ncbi:hypothetical protein [Mycolicibacterium aichiense]|uniref:hypothetical protein n=1 Tax=Mycolicibacterium aichiense TaxID=1799 RepID=UPI0011C02526|nr:hypothetical protein [Mycolicibacterium aichiense]MCV7017637.1 hypothetical protein [Mycolicibacterium aichiense]
MTLTTELNDGRPMWRLSWTECTNDHKWKKTHHNENAARRHVIGLVAKRRPGATMGDVFTDAR